MTQRLLATKVAAASAAYCERGDNDFDLWGEPLNFCTNFVQVGIGLYLLNDLKDRPNFDVNLPGVVLYIAVALGSAIWHSVGIGWTLYLDLAIPFVFIGWFAFHWTFRVLAVRAVYLRFVAVVVVFAGIGILAIIYESPLVGPHWAWFSVLCVGAVIHRFKCSWRPNALLKASVLYAIGLCFYALDRVACIELKGYQPGFHWCWHLVSALGGLQLIRSLPPEDWFVEGQEIKDPWCGALSIAAVHSSRKFLDGKTRVKVAPDPKSDLEDGGNSDSPRESSKTEEKQT